MKLLKLFIENFKGLEGRHIIEFDKGTTLLTGANGFGKTTIFDVIELCLTGKIHRTEVKKGVTNDKKDYIKPFFQNDSKNEVTLKLHLKKSCGQELVIVRHLHEKVFKRPKVSGRANKAHDFQILDLYSEDAGKFSEAGFDVESAAKIKQEDITDFFEFSDKDIDINGIYHIFNYLQQEEATYFLKKSEQERKNSLGFLLRTDIQEKKLKFIKDKIKKIKELKGGYSSELTGLRKRKLGDVEYKQIFENKKIKFDDKDPFLNLSGDELGGMLESSMLEAEKLIRFMGDFSPKEFTLKNLSNKVRLLLISDKDFKEHFVLSEMLGDGKYESLSSFFNDMNNEELLEAYVLQDVVAKYDVANGVNIRLNKVKEYEAAREQDKDGILSQLVELFSPDLKAGLDKLISMKKIQVASLNGLNKAILALEHTLKDLEARFDLIQRHEAKCMCPYCGTEFSEVSDLASSLEERRSVFSDLSADSAGDIKTVNQEIFDTIIRPIDEKVAVFKKEHAMYDEFVLQKLKGLKGHSYNFKNIEVYLAVNKDVFKWNVISSADDLEKIKKEIAHTLLAHFPADGDVWGKVVNLYTKDYSNAYELMEGWDFPHEIQVKIGPKGVSNSVVVDHVSKFTAYLEEKFNNIKFNPVKSLDQEGVYVKYFDSDVQQFEKVDVRMLEQKKEYLSYLFGIKENHLFNQYSNRIKKLDKVLIKLGKLEGVYDGEIKKYKKGMIEKIQVPFYIYTAKILQNYQQGMGIFISVKDDSAIRFVANGESDHDIMHHLSSGQLAVVALAFCLAINKTFQISPNLKFLAIDDPVQEMDALNIHSFIDLINTELSEEYQLLFSTHNHDNALFMKYKLEKSNKNSVGIIDVQQKFFPPLEIER